MFHQAFITTKKRYTDTLNHAISNLKRQNKFKELEQLCVLFLQRKANETWQALLAKQSNKILTKALKQLEAEISESKFHTHSKRLWQQLLDSLTLTAQEEKSIVASKKEKLAQALKSLVNLGIGIYLTLLGFQAANLLVLILLMAGGALFGTGWGIMGYKVFQKKNQEDTCSFKLRKFQLEILKVLNKQSYEVFKKNLKKCYKKITGSTINQNSVNPLALLRLITRQLEYDFHQNRKNQQYNINLIHLKNRFADLLDQFESHETLRTGKIAAAFSLRLPKFSKQWATHKWDIINTALRETAPAIGIFALGCSVFPVLKALGTAAILGFISGPIGLLIFAAVTLTALAIFIGLNIYTQHKGNHHKEAIKRLSNTIENQKDLTQQLAQINCELTQLTTLYTELTDATQLNQHSHSRLLPSLHNQPYFFNKNRALIDSSPNLTPYAQTVANKKIATP